MHSGLKTSRGVVNGGWAPCRQASQLVVLYPAPNTIRVMTQSVRFCHYAPQKQLPRWRGAISIQSPHCIHLTQFSLSAVPHNSEWNPAIDPHIPVNYDTTNFVQGKAACKMELQVWVSEQLCSMELQVWVRGVWVSEQLCSMELKVWVRACGLASGTAPPPAGPRVGPHQNGNPRQPACGMLTVVADPASTQQRHSYLQQGILC